MKVISSVSLFMLMTIVSFAQTSLSIKGQFPQAPNTVVLLKGYTMTGDTLLTKSNTDAKGEFTLYYPAQYVGAALLEIQSSKSVIVLLDHESFDLQWASLDDMQTLKFTNSPENDAFAKGMTVAQKSESKLAGLKYLFPLYATNLKNSKKEQWLGQEMKVQERIFPDFVKALPEQSYAAYYLNLRKFLQDMPATANRYIERMPAHEAQFNSMDFLDTRLLRSGLYEQLLVGYVTLMESHGDLPEVYKHINTSTDAFLKSMTAAPGSKQQAAEYLFKLFEKRSLFGAAEHLALAMLANNSCQMDTRQEALFEQYRKMAKGNIAPPLKFENTASGISQLSDIRAAYKLVVFGAGWCPTCVKEIPELKSFYENWKKENDLEVVLVSLDTNKVEYESFTSGFPWISTCDFKGWEGQAANDYCIFATPTMYLLDRNNKIVLKPISPEQINTWLKMNNGQD